LAGATHKQSDLRGILGGVLASSSDWDPYDSRQPRFGASPEDPNHLVWVYYRLTVGPYPESTCSGRGIGHCIRLAVALGIPTDQIVKALPRVRDDVVGTAMDPQGKGCRRALIAVAEGTARSRKARKAARAEFADLLRQRWQTQVEATTNGITSAVVDHERNTYERYVQAVAQRQAERARVAERSQAQREAARRRETDTEEDDRAFVSLYEATYGSCTAEVAAQRVRVTAEALHQKQSDISHFEGACRASGVDPSRTANARVYAEEEARLRAECDAHERYLGVRSDHLEWWPE
jgi:hypothetical protein